MDYSNRYGLVGRNISYSFSQKYFTQKFRNLFLNDHVYEIFDIHDISEVQKILKTENLKGFNVTIPYKEQIIPFLDDFGEEAAKIGAVNTVKIQHGKTTGYNTDVFGFERTLKLHLLPSHKTALILGGGGAAKAVRFVLEKLNIDHKTVARKYEHNFENLTQDMVSASKIIVQCTPVGTFPNVQDCLPFPFEALTPEHLVIDLIYNPEYTRFLQQASEFGAKCSNGYYMLEQQAEKAWQIWSI